MTQPEPTYTLAEARQVMNQQQCNSQGHDLAHIIYGSINPEQAVCARCSQLWRLITPAQWDQYQALLTSSGETPA